MLRDVYLHGAAGREFGSHFRLDVSTPAELFRALFALRPMFREFVRSRRWRVVVGRPHAANALTPDMLGMNLGRQSELHVVPAVMPRGGDGGNIGKIIAGVVLIGASLAFAPIGAMGFGAAMGQTAFMGMSFGSLALMGASMVLMGVSGLASQPPRAPAEPEQQARPEDRPSFLFNGVTNNTQQGGPVPLVFGRHLTGSVVINGGIAVEDIPV